MWSGSLWSRTRLVDGCKVGHDMRCSDGCRALVLLWSLRDGVGDMAIALLLVLVLQGLRAKGLLLGKVLRSLVEGLRREHGRSSHGKLSRIELAGSVGLHLVAGELLVEEHVPDAMLGGNVVVQLPVEQPRRRLQVSVQSLVLCRKVVVLLFVHFLVDDILLGDAQGATGALLVDLGSATGRLDACLETAVASTRCSNVGAGEVSGRTLVGERDAYRSWFSSWVRSVLTGLTVGKVVRRSAGMVW